MFFYQNAFASPAENLACDEVLLDLCDESPVEGFIRFWESPVNFVVLGYSKRLADEVVEEKCAELNIPIFRRASGGGTVLQGPGGLNYCVVLPIDSTPELGNITAANCYIMKKIRAAVQEVCDRPIEIQGYTDLTVDNRKFSGNAQRRKRRALMFHGSFLLNFDLALIQKVLRHPADQPAYRAKRDHLDFLTTVPLSKNEGDSASERVSARILEAWGPVTKPLISVMRETLARVEELVKEKYSRRRWNRKF